MAYASDSHRRRVEIIGHRGSPRVHKENTLPSFRRAFEEGAVAIELDVHGTADGVVVVHHDAATNSRLGDSGQVVVIAESTLDALRAVVVGAAPMPTLAETLADVPESATVYVEVKAKGIETAVIDAIRGSGRTCAVHSFDHRIARRIQQLAPDIPVGILQTSYPIDPIQPMRDAGARDLWQHWELIDDDLIARVHAAGGRVIAWTVNLEAVAERLITQGIDGICSDVPGAMRALSSRVAGV